MLGFNCLVVIYCGLYIFSQLPLPYMYFFSLSPHLTGELLIFTVTVCTNIPNIYHPHSKATTVSRAHKALPKYSRPSPDVAWGQIWRRLTAEKPRAWGVGTQAQACLPGPPALPQ